LRKIDVSALRVPPGSPVDLARWPTRSPRLYSSRHDYEKTLAAHVKQLAKLQHLLYAHDRYSLLLIFQAMDAAGKDGAIKHVMSGVNPQGCQVFSFKHPGPEELEHDFLWRTTRCLPERGRIGIFNRSYYEEVLIVRVHPEILRAEALPRGATDVSDFWQHRYDSINAFERHLHRNGTRILKFFLHLSKEEQRVRFLARLDDPAKQWKFSRADIAERGFWDQYMHAYAACLEATSSEHAPWFVVPADDKDNARLIVSQLIVDALGKLPLAFPEPLLGARELKAVRRKLGR
jgi:PPK2 family polyphosphate:nucleotide phosphotransferase